MEFDLIFCFLPFIIPAVATVAGAAIGANAGAHGQASANAANAAEAERNRVFNAAEAEKNRVFQADQSATAYQRKVADLKKAGLNPALAYEGGGATTPSGSSASGTPARFESVGAQGVSNAVAVASAVNSLATAVAERKNIEAQTRNVEAKTTTEDLTRSAHLGLLSSQSAHYHQSAVKTSEEFKGRLIENLLLRSLRESEIGKNVSTAREADSRRELNLFDIYRGRFGIQALKNEEAKAKTSWGKNVSPYLHDAGSVFRSFTDLWKFRR